MDQQPLGPVDSSQHIAEPMKGYQSIIFFTFAAVFSLSTFVEPYPLSWVVKLLPMAVLITFTYHHLQTKADKLFLAGLIFSAAGDFFLDYDRINFFVFGLGSFLIAHVFYIFCLRPAAKKYLAAVLFYCLYGTLIFWIILPGLGELLIPVLAYMGVLMLMGVFTLISTRSNIWLIAGGACFVISDSIIGIDKFYVSIPYAHFVIMVTYYFAQYSLVRGIFYNRSNIVLAVNRSRSGN